MPGFGEGSFGEMPFGDWDWSDEVLYGLLPSEDKKQDESNGLVLRQFLRIFEPLLNRIKSSIEGWSDLRNPLTVRTQDQDAQLIRLGDVIDPMLPASKQGIDGSIQSVGIFTSPSARFSVEDKGKYITLWRSSLTGNNRTFQVARVLSTTEIITDPLALVDEGLIRWSLTSKQSLETGEMSLQVIEGDVSKVTLGWLLFDGNSVYEITSRKQTVSEDINKPLIELSYQDAEINSSGLFVTPTGVFTTDDVGKRLALLGMANLDQEGIYRIFKIETSGSVVLSDESGSLVALDRDTGPIEGALLPYPLLTIKSLASPRGASIDSGVHAEILSADIIHVTQGNFDAESVGRYLHLSNSKLGNDGLYQIIDVLTSSKVQISGSLVVETDLRWFERVYLDSVTGGDGSQVKIYPESILKDLAIDFGIEVDEQESVERQRSWVRHISQWLGLKGTAKAYELLGDLSGLIVDASPLFSISYELSQGLPTLDVFQVGETDPGRLGTDGSLFRTVIAGTFQSPTSIFDSHDVGKLLSVNGADEPLNNGIYTITGIISANEIELSPQTQPYETDNNNGTLNWSLTRLYTETPPTRPRFDEVRPELLDSIVSAESGGALRFRMDHYCWEDDWSSDVIVNIDSATSIDASRWVLQIEDDTNTGFPNAPEVVTGVGQWLIEDSAGELYYLETVPSGGPLYAIEVLSITAPALGSGILRYECPIITTCSYCASSAVLLAIEFGSVASEAGQAIRRAVERFLDRVLQVKPIHVTLIPRLKAEIICDFGSSFTIEGIDILSSMMVPFSLRFDSLPADIVPLDGSTIKVVIETP